MKKTPQKQQNRKSLCTAVLAVLAGVLLICGCNSEKEMNTAAQTGGVGDTLQVYGVRFEDGIKKSDINRIREAYALPLEEKTSVEQEKLINTEPDEDDGNTSERLIETENPDDYLTAEELVQENALVVRVQRYLEGKTDITGEPIKRENKNIPEIEVIEPISENAGLEIYPAEEESGMVEMPVLYTASALEVPLFAAGPEPETPPDGEGNGGESTEPNQDSDESTTPDTPEEPAPKRMLLKSTSAERSKDVIMLARLIYGEARNIPDRAQWAAVCWCALNRLDSGKYGDTLKYVLTRTNKDSRKRADQQFTGYSRLKPSSKDLDKYTAILKVAADVYAEWEKEQETEVESDRRTLPKEYLYYWGDNTRNYFVQTATERHNKDKSNAWDWSKPESNPYTEDLKEIIRNYTVSDYEKTLMAKQVWHKARGLRSKMERAAVVWCILNRLESQVYEDSIEEILLHPLQFADIKTPGSLPDTSYYELVEDVVERWNAERDGEADVGRVLPKCYIYFHGTEDEKTNLYYDNPFQRRHWRWESRDPYTENNPET